MTDRGAQYSVDRSRMLELFNGLEHEFNPYQHRIDGAPIWPLLRISLGTGSMSSEMMNRPPIMNIELSKRIARIFSGLAQQWKLYRHVSCEFLFFTSPVYQYTLNGATIDRLAHPMIQAAAELGRHSVLIVKDGPSLPPLLPVKNCHIIPLYDLIYSKSLLFWRKPKKKIKSLTEFQPIIKKLSQALPMVAQVDLDQALHTFRFNLEFYFPIIRKLAPSHVFLSCWYAVENLAIAHICHELDIPCTDLQHGVQGPAHLAYGTWADLPKGGCSTIPSRFWCWDEESARNIRSWAPPHQHRPFVGGYAWFGPNRLPTNDQRSHRHRILYSMQPISDPIPERLGALIKNGSPDHFWTFRLHPAARSHKDVLMKWVERWGITDKVALEDPLSVPLVESLSNSNIHITQYSSVILEAAYLGIPSIALHSNAKNIFNDLLLSGVLISCDSIEKLPTLLVRTRNSTSEMVEIIPLGQRLKEFLDWSDMRLSNVDPF